jgi:hypothetical protein
MSIRDRWRVVETPGYDMAVAGAYILFDEDGGEFAFDCLTGSIHIACDPATTTPSSATGRETTKWSQPTVTAGRNCRMTAHSEVKSACSTATTSHLSHVEQRLLQRPAKGPGSLPLKLMENVMKVLNAGPGETLLSERPLRSV